MPGILRISPMVETRHPPPRDKHGHTSSSWDENSSVITRQSFRIWRAKKKKKKRSFTPPHDISIYYYYGIRIKLFMLDHHVNTFQVPSQMLQTLVFVRGEKSIYTSCIYTTDRCCIEDQNLVWRIGAEYTLKSIYPTNTKKNK